MSTFTHEPPIGRICTTISTQHSFLTLEGRDPMFSWLLYATFGRGRISPKAAYDTHHVVLYVAVSASPYCGYTYTGPRKEIAADLQRCFRQNEMAVPFPLHVVLYAAVSAILGIWNARRCVQSIRVDGPSVPEGDNEHGVRKYRPHYSYCGNCSAASTPTCALLFSAF